MPQLKSSFRVLFAAIVPFLATVAWGLDGQIFIHDPSTIMFCNGKYYTYGTGGTALVSDDGWTWRAGVRPPRSGMAPDVIRIGDRYYMYISRNVGAQPKAEVFMIWTRSLDPDSPDYKWEEGGIIVTSDGIEDCNAIDPGLFLDPNDGRLWMTYGSYFGYIRLVELDPKTGKRLNPKVPPLNIAINMEATTIIYHDGWYYLLGTRGSCCRGSDSGYNIRVGRARKVTGPYVDHTGLELLRGGGKLVIGSGGRVIGPGHFGLIDLGDGVQKFSMHWEADLDRGGRSVLDIRPLLWKDGWPVAGENPREGTYVIESVRTGTVLEMAVEGVPVGGRRPARGGPPPAVGPVAPGPGRAAPGPQPQAGTTPGRGPAGPALPAEQIPVIPSQEAAHVSDKWPGGPVDVRMANYLCQAQQKWTLTPVPNAGGYLGAPYFKITIAGTDRALAVTQDAELIVLPKFTGGPEQLWRLDQLTDGTWRIMPKAIPGSTQQLALSAVGASFATLAKFDPKSDKQRWLLKTP